MDENNTQTEGEELENVSLQKLQEDLDNAMNGWKRAAADFQNYKKRQEAENKELVEFAREVTVAKLLPALDSLEQALKHMPELPSVVSPFMGSSEDKTADKSANYTEFQQQYRNWQTGVNGIVIQLDKTLGELGVKKIEAVGKKFDPHFHEAVREVESEKDDGIVVDELQTGFELNGRVIRPSQVTISKKK
ncbi:MAG TPA: nucleotide exchange factor GrpE [Candidatus Limnocylindria bacterium]|nr:nucleotide exchange factor GrpE [Candidatus Limnocylindria bacterium]